MNRQRNPFPALLASVALTLLLSACGAAAVTPLPTRPPAPTFTPTPEIVQQPVDPAAVATAQAQADAAQPPAPAAPAEGGQAVATATAPNDGAAQGVATATPPTAPTETPTAQAPAEVVVTSVINVRGGPGTAYNIIGGANQGERFPVTGRNSEGTWWQINYNGQTGWVFGELVTPQNVETVAVAQNIPTPPPAPPTPVPAPPTNTPPPAAPTEPPKPKYKFNITAVSKCAPQEAGTWFEGRTYIGGNPTNGFKVVFSYAPDGPWATEPMISGPHKGYEGWNTGYYSHIISAPGSGPRAGTWYVWIVDEGGARISEVASWTSKGKGGDCNQAAVDFDSR